MIAMHMLEESDTIHAGDYVRQLSLIFNGQSENLETVSCYGGSPVNRLGWLCVETVCPFWIGKTVGELNEGSDFKHRHQSEVTRYEFIRGKIPLAHLEGE